VRRQRSGHAFLPIGGRCLTRSGGPAQCEPDQDLKASKACAIKCHTF
jgi:hypothetical protein